MSLPPGDHQLVQIMDAVFADAAQRAGDWLACRPGCAQCCYGAFPISALDAARLHAGLHTLQQQNPAAAARVLQRVQTWIDVHGAAFPGDLHTGLLHSSDEAQEAFEDFANDAACPALDPSTGQCDLYAWRPMTCRVFGPPVRMGEGDALGCCELCFVGATEEQIAACEMHPPHEVEAQLLAQTGSNRETILAFALLGLGQPELPPR